MTCHICGQPSRPTMTCVTALRAELRRKEIITSDLYEACKEARDRLGLLLPKLQREELVASELLEACKAGRDWIWSNANVANLRRSPTLAQMELATERAEEESNAGA